MKDIEELLEPKLPPINLWCMVPAFYLNWVGERPEAQYPKTQDSRVNNINLFYQQIRSSR